MERLHGIQCIGFWKALNDVTRGSDPQVAERIQLEACNVYIGSARPLKGTFIIPKISGEGKGVHEVCPIRAYFQVESVLEAERVVQPQIRAGPIHHLAAAEVQSYGSECSI